MKFKAHTNALIAIGCAVLAGCALPAKTVRPLASGYSEATYTRGLLRPSTHFSLQYDGRTVWPDIGGTHIKSDVAVFTARTAERSPLKWDSLLRMKTLIFAVRAPAPPLNIHPEIVRIWAAECGKEYSTALKKASIVSIEEKQDALEFHFAVWTTEDWPKETVSMSWSNVFAIMQEIEGSGITRSDPRYGSKFVERAR